MRVFASWSGADSREAAELMKDWLPNVVQEVDVWVSSQDISKGEKWSDSLWASLTEHQFGLLFVTKTNFASPWILFEAGALAKTVKSFVIPVLCNVDRIDLSSSPLNQFQNAIFEKEEIYRVVEAISRVSDRPIPLERLRANFEKWWPDLEESFAKIKFKDNVEHKQTGAKADSERLSKIESALESVMGTLNKLNRDSSPPAGSRNKLVEAAFISRDQYNALKRAPIRRFTPVEYGEAQSSSANGGPEREGPDYSKVPDEH